MPLYEDIKEWTDEDGIIIPQQKNNPSYNSETGNSLYTWLYYILLWEKDELRKEDVFYEFNALYEKCKVHGYEGLINRTPSKGTLELQAFDDYVSLTLASKIIYKSIISRDIAFHGMSHNYSWNNQQPETWTFKTFFARMPWLIAHFYNCANLSVNFALKTALNGYLCSFGLSNKSENSWILSWCMIKGITDPDFMQRYCINYWYKCLNKKYKDGMKGVLANHLHPDHPLTHYWNLE